MSIGDVISLQLSDPFQVGCDHSGVSRWFRTYGYAGVYDHLIVGAVPLDSNDVDRLATLRVSRMWWNWAPC